jgi:hypothetical protein
MSLQIAFLAGAGDTREDQRRPGEAPYLKVGQYICSPFDLIRSDHY